MRTIYIDSDFKCYTVDNGTMTVVKTDFFDDKCDVFIEGYRFVPNGKSWTRSDGVAFAGEMVAPWKNFNELAAAQQEYEQQLLQEYKNEKEELNASYNKGINSI